MKYLTIVYRLPDDYDASEFANHKHVSASSWCHAIDEKNRAIERAERDALKWMPIETAPKGKPGFLACNAQDYGDIEWLIDHGGNNFLNQNSSNYTPKRYWTHWMPIPPAADAAMAAHEGEK